MRLLLHALLISLLAGCASTPKSAFTSVEIEEIKPRYIKEEQFKRISEYLTGKENTSGRVIIRSTLDERAGYYFTLILDEQVRALPKGTVIVGEFFTPISVEKQTHEFALPNKRARTKEVFVGLTGEDWPSEGGVPSAWKFTIKDPNGKVLGQKQSYLWSL